MTKVKTRPQADKESEGNVARKPGPTPKLKVTTKPEVTTKKAQLIKLLSGRAGSDIAGLSKKLGWQPHTTRAALTRLRQSGYEISSVKQINGKPSKYRITAAPAEQSAQ